MNSNFASLCLRESFWGTGCLKGVSVAFLAPLRYSKQSLLQNCSHNEVSSEFCNSFNIERMEAFMAEMTAEEAAEWGKTLDFPTVWATLTKLGERMDARAERVDRIMANTAARIDKLGERVDRVTANVGGLNVSMGELIETLFGPHIGEKFDAYQYNLKRIFKRVPIYDDASRQRGEIDLLLSNTTVCMALEVKRWLDGTAEIDKHIQRMKLIRQYPPAEAKGKKLLGAMAGAVVTVEAREYAEANGFFVLELTGDDVRLLEPPEHFQPKEW
jgi:hypothetical protein